MPLRKYPDWSDVSDTAVPMLVAALRGQLPEPRHGVHCLLECAEYAAGQLYDDVTGAKKAGDVWSEEPLTSAEIANRLESAVGGMRSAAQLPWAQILQIVLALLQQLLPKPA